MRIMSSNEEKGVSVEITGVEAKTELNDIGHKRRIRKPNKAKFENESIDGREWSTKLKRFVSIKRFIDRENNYYYEQVIDDETGEVLRECKEPLSEHVNRGHAKQSLENE
jgi:hypothetical protein